MTCIALVASTRQNNNLSRQLTDGTVKTPLEEELPDLVIASGVRMDDTTTTVFSLEAHISTPTQSAIDADRTDFTSPTIADFTTARSLNEVYRNAAR